MATLKDLETEIREMAKFYADLSEDVRNDPDKDYAQMGKESAENILSLIDKYQSDPKNTYLKLMQSNLMTLTRGIESFQDRDIQKIHKKYGEVRLKLYKYIDENVKW